MSERPPDFTSKSFLLHEENFAARQPRLSYLLKRCVDVIGSGLLLLVLVPLLVLLAMVVLLDDSWPFIYRRRVVGMEGSFDAFKFRTMRRDSEAILNADPLLRAEFEQNYKLKVDPRVTRSGSVLRKFSLDELPQLVNVFLGQMSLVGPRMVTAPELAKYGPHRDLLLTVRPGLTGYWQVSGRRNKNYQKK